MRARPDREVAGSSVSDQDGWTRLEVRDDALPAVFPSPFDELGPHAVARTAAEQLQAELRSGAVDLGGEGKMFGVLVVRRRDGSVGFLRAFSGTVRGQWRLPGFVPPVFDPRVRDAVEGPGERQVSAITERSRAFESSDAFRAGVEACETELAAQRESEAACRTRHRLAREQRRVARERISADLALSDERRAEALHALDQESRRDKAELRRLQEAHAQRRAVIDRALRRLHRRRDAHVRLRSAVSRRLMQRIHDAYVLRNARGELRSLRALFAPREPPSGAADCAGPKLIAAALAHGWTPLALAEFWWGPPPAAGGRLEGSFYPACAEKCGPVLPFMLEGLEVAAPRRFTPPRLEREPLRIVHEDPTLVVVDKPEGLLSIPGKDAIGDSVLERLRERHPRATGPLLVHRLDLDTSGLLVACLDARAHAALQKQFLERTVEKRYVAVLDGEVSEDSGRIELPLRVDLHDRPRQIHDPLHGKPAVTEWQVVSREEGRTRVHLFPRTGRTHQLRVHAAHPLGLGAPIVGDRLYGRSAPRLLLHAEQLSFMHPVTGERVVVTVPAPF